MSPALTRLDALGAVYDRLADLTVVTIMGAVAAELQSLGHRENFFYLQHAMGLASSMGLGIALAQPHRGVVVLDGDGSLLMNLGGLTTLARYRPGNLLHVVFDNESLLSAPSIPRRTVLHAAQVAEPFADIADESDGAGSRDAPGDHGVATASSTARPRQSSPMPGPLSRVLLARDRHVSALGKHRVVRWAASTR
ncbi:MAG: thiamine pyrophosphate-dependent enzyme [Vicinamibacterales bacterium]